MRKVQRLAHSLYLHRDRKNKVAVIIWERSCDCVEFERQAIIPATVKAYDALVEQTYDSAEGPVSFRIAKPVRHFEGYHRDRIMEAFENGHSWRV